MRLFALLIIVFFSSLFAKESNRKDTKQTSSVKITQKEISSKLAVPLIATMQEIGLTLVDKFPELLTHPEQYEGLFYFLANKTNIPIKAEFLLKNTKILSANETIYRDMLSKISLQKTYDHEWFSVLENFIENKYDVLTLKSLLKKTSTKSIKNGITELINSLGQKIELPDELLKIQTLTANITPENVQAILAMKTNLNLASNDDVIKSLKIHMNSTNEEQSILYANTILSLEEHDLDALKYLYNYHKNSKNYETSTFYLKKLYETSKEYAYQLALALKQTNELDLAHSIISQEKGTQAHLKLKYEIELASNNLPEATKTLTTLYETFPSTENRRLLANQLFTQAQAEYQSKQLQSSSQNLQKSINLLPTSRAYTLLADIYKETSDDQHKAILAYKKAYELQPTKKTSENLNNSTHNYLTTGEIDDNWVKLFDMLTSLDVAMKYYEKTLSSELTQKEKIADKYHSLFKNNTENLEKAIENNLKLLPTHTQTLALQAKVASNKKDYEQAHAIYKNLVMANKPFTPQLVDTTLLIVKQHPDDTEKTTSLLMETLKIIPNNKTLTNYLALNTKSSPPTEDIYLKEKKEEKENKENKENKEKNEKNKKNEKNNKTNKKANISDAYTLYYEEQYQTSLETLTKGLEKAKTRQKDVLLTIVLNLRISSQHKVSAISSWKNLKIDTLREETPYDDTFYLLLDLSELLKPINQQESLRAIRTALQLTPSPFTEQSRLKLEEVASSNLANKHYMSAFILYTKLSKLVPENKTYTHNAGLSAYYNKNYTTAINILTPLPDAPSDILKSSYINKGYLEFSKNDKTGAKTSLLQAKRLGASESEFLNVPTNQTNKTEWETFVQTEAMENSEKIIENLENLELLVEQDPPKAIASLQALEKSSPNNAPIYNLLARAYLKKYDWNKAYEYTTLSAKADNSPENKNTLNTLNQNIAFQALNNNDLPIANEAIESSLKFKENDPYSLVIAGDVKFAYLDIVQARQYWKQANSSTGKPIAAIEEKLFKTNFIDSYPKDINDRIKKIESDKLPNPTPEQKLFFSQSYTEKGESESNEKALLSYKTSLEYNDKNIVAINHLTKIYEDEKDWRYAIYYLQKALRITNNQQEIAKLNANLSDIYVKYSDDLLEKGQNIDAKSMLHQAIKANPQNKLANEKLKKL